MTLTIYFFDTSALVKFYVSEPGSAWVRGIMNARKPKESAFQNTILLAEITRVEVSAGLAIIERVGRIRRIDRRREYTRFTSHFVNRYAIIPIDSPMLEMAAELAQRYPLKAYDAVQLAAALRQERSLATVKRSLVFVSGDRSLLVAASAEGVAVDTPFDNLSPEDLHPQGPGS